jgi:hypothetical protein
MIWFWPRGINNLAFIGELALTGGQTSVKIGELTSAEEPTFAKIIAKLGVRRKVSFLKRDIILRPVC